MKFLFWNILGKNLEDAVAQIALDTSSDVVVLAEVADSARVTLALNRERAPEDFFTEVGLDNDETHDVKIFTRRLPAELVTVEKNTPRAAIVRVVIPGAPDFDFLLAAAHLPSKWTTDNPANQSSDCTWLAEDIASCEARVGHHRTVLVGDLNVNPFEPGLAVATGLNAVSSRRQAKRVTRKIKDKSIKYFYNPMWSHFGDHPNGPGGTYYYRESENSLGYFWHMLDQVLIRPDLLNHFDSGSLTIVTTVGQQSLLTKDTHVPNRKKYSDHLPITFELST